MPPLVYDAQQTLKERSPFGLLALASGLVEVTTPRPTDAWGKDRGDRPDARETFESFASSGWPAMSALALAAATLHPDADLARDVRHLVDTSQLVSGPSWLASMDEIVVDEVHVHSDPFGDGENVALSWSWRRGESATLIAYVDHNMGTVVKDAFGIPEGAEAVADLYGRLGDRQMSIGDLDPADARARLTEAIDSGERVVPPIETDSWPSCRPMLEWVVRRLPAGGTGYVRPEWSEADRERLLDTFVASEFASVEGLSAEQVWSLADPLVWFGCDYGPGDPLRWSPVSVEIVLTDWYPRKVFGVPEPELRRVPDVLSAFVRYSHRRQGIEPDLTEDTIASIDLWRGEFGQAIGRPGRSPVSNAAWLARVAAGYDPAEVEEFDEFDDFDGIDELDDISTLADELDAAVIELVGGRRAYDDLDDSPLDDVAFDWSRVPAELHAPTGAALEHLERWSIELFDAEVRTIARAVLAGVVAADTGVFKRSDRADALAAGILSYLMQRLTGRMSRRERRELPWTVATQKELAAATGVTPSTISGRTRTIAKVVERADIDWPANLHSTQREEALRTKQLIADWRRQHLS